MKELKRLLALLLSILLVFPAQHLIVMAKNGIYQEVLTAKANDAEAVLTERIGETLPLEEMSIEADTEMNIETNIETERVQETLALEPQTEEAAELSLAIYWHPGKNPMADNATASNSEVQREKATESTAPW